MNVKNSSNPPEAQAAAPSASSSIMQIVEGAEQSVRTAMAQAEDSIAAAMSALTDTVATSGANAEAMVQQSDNAIANLAASPLSAETDA